MIYLNFKLDIDINEKKALAKKLSGVKEDK